MGLISRVSSRTYRDAMRISVQLRFFDEVPMSFGALSPSSLVSDLQDRIELKMGIPTELQRLSFLDNINLVSTRTLQSYGISHRSRVSLKLFSELDWKEIILASRRSDMTVLKSHKIIDDRVIAVDKYATVAVPRASTSMSEFSPLKRFDKSAARSTTVEKSWTMPIEEAKNNRNNRGVYTFWRAISGKEDIKTVQQRDLQTWRSYRLFVCALSAMACSRLTLLQILYDQDKSVFQNVRTKSSNRSILHIAACMGRERCLKMILYRFDGMYEIMHDLDSSKKKAARLSRISGERSCSQILLYFDWQRRNTIDEGPPSTDVKVKNAGGDKRSAANVLM